MAVIAERADDSLMSRVVDRAHLVEFLGEIAQPKVVEVGAITVIPTAPIVVPWMIGEGGYVSYYLVVYVRAQQ